VGAYDGPLLAWDRLPDVADVVVADMFLANDGIYYYTDDPMQPVRFGEVQVGDLLTIEDHVGVVYQDRGRGGGGDGLLGGEDRLLEAYFEPLRETAAGEAFVSDITVYRVRGGESL